MLSRRLMMQHQRGGDLPSAYIPVQYIKSDGNQYINTGVIGNENTRMEVNVFGRVQGSIFGCRDAVDQNNISGFFDGSQFFLDFVGNGESWKYGRLQVQTYLAKFPYLGITSKSKREVINAEGSQGVNNWLYTGAMKTGELLLFRIGGNPPWPPAAIGIGYCEIYDSDIEIRSLIACVRASDKKPGMFDVVNQKFYTNEGSGEFTWA